MNKSTVIQLVSDAVKNELDENWKDELIEEQRDFVLENMKYMSEEIIALALEQDEKKKEFHRRNIEHYRNVICSIKAIVKIKGFNSLINVVGRVIAGIAIATGRNFV